MAKGEEGPSVEYDAFNAFHVACPSRTFVSSVREPNRQKKE